MSRTITSGMLTALSATDIQPVIFASIGFVSSTVNLWSGYGSTTWNSITWSGVGSLLDVSVIEDGATVEARGITIQLSGLNASLLSSAMTDFHVGLPVSVYLGVMSGGSIVSTPIVSWAGRTDLPTVKVSGETATIELTCESRLVEMNVPANRRLTLQDAQMSNPDDLGLMFVDAIQEMTLYWGNFPTGANNI